MIQSPSKFRTSPVLVVVGGILLCALTWHINHRTARTIARHEKEPDLQSLQESRPELFHKTTEEGSRCILCTNTTLNNDGQDKQDLDNDGNGRRVVSMGSSEQNPRNMAASLDLKCSYFDEQCSEAQERLNKQETFSVPAVFPRGGNTLPNFFLHGIAEGISPSDYRDGVLCFLHLNKAGGTTIKTCMNETVEKGILRDRSVAVISSGSLSVARMSFILDHDVLMGDHIFGLCEHFGRKKCSYFTFLRDPYERALSSYYYCKEREDQLCGPLDARDVTAQQWVIYQGSYFFYELLMDRKYCVGNQIIADLLRYGMEDSPLVPPGANKYISPETATSCWFKQRVYLGTFVNDIGREAILRNILDNLETWFSLIGLREEYDLSLKMLAATYNLPFYELCSALVVNKTPVSDSNDERERKQLLPELKSSPAVADALKYDIKIYERGREIFQRQKARFT